MQDLARREQSRRDSDAWITAQRLKRAKIAEEREDIRMAEAQGKDWRDPENGVEMGMGRQEGFSVYLFGRPEVESEEEVGRGGWRTSRKGRGRGAEREKSEEERAGRDGDLTVRGANGMQ